MSVIEFDTNVENGIIKIPEKFINEISNSVKVIVLNKEVKSTNLHESDEKQILLFRELPKSILNPIKAGNFKFFTREELNER